MYLKDIDWSSFVKKQAVPVYNNVYNMLWQSGLDSLEQGQPIALEENGVITEYWGIGVLLMAMDESNVFIQRSDGVFMFAYMRNGGQLINVHTYVSMSFPLR